MRSIQKQDQQNKRNLKRCILLSILIAAVIAVFLEIGMQLNGPQFHDYDLSENTPEYSYTLDNQEVELVAYRREGDTLFPQNEDPQILLNLGDMTHDTPIHAVRLLLNTPLEEDMFMQVFYSDQHGNIAEALSRTQMVSAGSQSVFFLLPGEYVPLLRLDVNGVVSIEQIDIYTSHVSATTVPQPFNVFRFITVTAIGSILILLAFLFGLFAKIKYVLCGVWRSVKAQPKAALKKVLVTLGIMLVCCLLVFAATKIFNRPLCAPYFVFAGIFGFVVSMFILFYKYVGKKPEIFFLMIFLSAGMLIATFSPCMTTLASWDEETHYKRIVNMAYIGEETKFTGADLDYINRVYGITFSQQDRETVFSALEESYQKGALPEGSFYEDKTFSYYSIAYAPAAFGGLIGRALGLPFLGTLLLARYLPLILYAFLFYFGMKKLKTGKMIFAVIALIPTLLFIASHYSYDIWLVAFLMFGFAYYFSEIQHPEQKLSTTSWVVMLVSMCLGLAPKAVYFPMAALLLFMPKNKFVSKKHRMGYILSILAVIAFAMFSFVLPRLFGGMGTGDMRGGEEVNATLQLAFILQNPLSYAKILGRFLVDYLSFSNAWLYLTSFAYLGNGKMFIVLLVLLGIVTFTDRDKKDGLTTTLAHKARTWIAALLTTAAVATALYISFTPVGFETVNGCQERYLLPLLFPVLYVAGSANIRVIENRNRYNALVFAVSGLVLFLNIGNTIIRFYH